MKTTRKRCCALFPWLFRSMGLKTHKDRGMAATELSGFGEGLCLAKEHASYISLRDIMAAQKRNSSLSWEMEEIGSRFNNHARSPKSLLLEKAAHAWLQPLVVERSQQQSDFFSRFWTRLTSPSMTATPSRPSYSFSSAIVNCMVYCPFLKWLDPSLVFQHLRKPQPYPLLRQ